MLKGNGLCIRCLGWIIRTKRGSLHAQLRGTFSKLAPVGYQASLISGFMFWGVGDTSNCKDSGYGGFKEATFYFPIAKA